MLDYQLVDSDPENGLRVCSGQRQRGKSNANNKKEMHCRVKRHKMGQPQIHIIG